MNSARLQDTRLIYRNLLHFSTLIMKYEKVFKIPFKILSKRKKVINLTKEVKDLYSKNFKTLMKEFKDDTKK